VSESKVRLRKAPDEEACVAWYLSKFEYYDWNVGDDDQLRVGDYMRCGKQDHNGHDIDFISGKIVLHHASGIPMFLINLDENEEGDYVGLHDLFMEGYEFARISKQELASEAIHPTQPAEGEKK